MALLVSSAVADHEPLIDEDCHGGRARPQSENGFKIELAKRCLTHALQTAALS